MVENESYDLFVQLIWARLQALVAELQKFADSGLEAMVTIRSYLSESERIDPATQEGIGLKAALYLQVAGELRRLAGEFQRVGERAASELVEPLKGDGEGHMDAASQLMGRLGAVLLSKVLHDELPARRRFSQALQRTADQLWQTIRKKWASGQS